MTETLERKPLMQAVGVTKSFQKEKQSVTVLRGVDFSIFPGECVAITGPSGVGKSTLLHILGTLEVPTSGKVYYGENKQEVFSYSERALAQFRNKALGFVFQFHYLLPEFTAVENVMMPALIAGHEKARSAKQARELLEFVGLSHRLDHRPSEMSGGEQQRVAIARAVILRPKILLADELTGNLDSASSEQVVELLARLNKATGVSIALVTHDLSLASRMDRVVQMKDGLVSKQGSGLVKV